MDDNSIPSTSSQLSPAEQEQLWNLKDSVFSVNMTGKSYDQEFPKTFEGFGYRFNEFGQLQHIKTGEPFNFDEKENDHVYNQRRYEALGELVTDYVYGLLTECGLRRLAVPIDAAATEPSTFIFHSKNAFTKDKLVILIHGSGVVRAGQWARRLIINDSLNTGTQVPFVRRAMGLGYGVIVLNTNDNAREVNDVFLKIRGSENAENHANYVWEKVILAKAAAKYIAIVAHSYGGIVTVNMCKSFPESFQKRVIAIAFTDSPHSLVGQYLPQELIEFMKKVSRNWVSSVKPLDVPLILDSPHEVDCYSAGTQRHDMTSWMSFSSIYEFIDKRCTKTIIEEEEREREERRERLEREWEEELMRQMEMRKALVRVQRREELKMEGIEKEEVKKVEAEKGKVEDEQLVDEELADEEVDL